ncbi:MAG TPA: hypothetical protein VG276_28910 [Actinomycetes bacterium]|nr:hypothetical protein [Actinomycetes bacterium]
MSRDPHPADDYAAWKPLAEATRQALDLLGYGTPRCLPGEPEACGGNFAEHALGHLAALKAVVEHRIAHLGEGSGPMVEQVYAATLATLRRTDPCDQGHQS